MVFNNAAEFVYVSCHLINMVFDEHMGRIYCFAYNYVKISLNYGSLKMVMTFCARLVSQLLSWECAAVDDNRL